MTPPPLVLTGPPAVGKSTCGRLVAAARERGAFLDVDDLRHLVVGGHAAPWEGPEGDRQRLLGVDHACTLTRSFGAAGFDVVVADVLTPTTAQRYRDALPGCRIVRFTIDDAEVAARAASRPRWITDDEFRMLLDEERTAPPRADVTVDVTGMSVDEQVAAVRAAWTAS